MAIPTGLGLIYLSYEEAAEGTQETFGSYRSDIGSQVLASFSAETYPGERNRALELGVDVGTAGLLAGLGKMGVELFRADKYLPKNLSKFSDDVGEWLGKRVAAKEATAPVEKFANYIFKDGATHGKDDVFRGLGFGKEHSGQLATMWEDQAAAKFARGEYTHGKLDQYGQRINIEIEVSGIGDATGKTSYIQSGWMIKPDGSIKLNTPFAGFTR